MGTYYTINDTTSYHREGLKTLGWELTVTNAMEEPLSPCRSVVNKQGSFGELLFDHLSATIPFNSIASVIEIGGGYGYLMRDFMRRGCFTKAAMIDLSPVLLEKQKEILKDFDISFIENDFFWIDTFFFHQFDLAVLNEIVGDFPTICDISPDFHKNAGTGADPIMDRVRHYFKKYTLPIPDESFNFNIGAVEAVEKLCSTGVRYIYLSEHSCEARVPADMKDKIRITGPNNPERIPLMGHYEYTIRFSYLEHVAEQLGYRVQRGQYRDFIPFAYTDKLNFILTSNSQKDEHEIIRQFVEDLYKYEYLLLIRR